MRICYIGWADYPHVQRWAKWFAARGHDVHILSHQSPSLNGVIIHDIRPARSGASRLGRLLRGELNISAAYWLRTALRVRQLVGAIQPDILHSHSLYYPGYMGAVAGFQPYVITAWNYDDVTLEYAPHALTRPFRRLFARYALGRARLVTGISQNLVRALLQARSPRDRTITFNWGATLDLFNPLRPRRDARRILGLPEDDPVVLSTRNIDETRNVETIVRAIPEVVRRVPRVRFLFTWNYAQPGLLRRVQQELQRQGLQDRVQWVGRVPHEDLAVYYQAADVFVSLALWDSGPISMLEAMACGAVPVMGTLPSVREWIEDGVNGYLVFQRDVAQVAEAIVHVLQRPDVHEEMACRNWRTVQERANFDERMGFMEQQYRALTVQ